MLQWARERNIPWDARTFNFAAMHGNLELLDWLWKKQCPLDGMFMVLAARHRTRAREVMRWAREHDCLWGSHICAYAADRGDLGLHQWLREPEQQCPWGSETLAVARRGGHDEVYQWALANGCLEEESDDEDEDDEDEDDEEDDDDEEEEGEDE